MRIPIVAAAWAVLLVGACRPVDSRLCAPCSLDVCGEDLRCLEGVCVPPDVPVVCDNYEPPPACGDQPPCGDAFECFEGACRTPSDIRMGWDHACALWPSGRVECWGGNVFGQTGNPEQARRSPAFQITSFDDAVELGVGVNFSCARRANGDVMCWGSSEKDQLGHQKDFATGFFDGPQPRRVSLEVKAKRLFVGVHRSCVIGEDDQLYCWGGGGRGCVFGDDVADDNLIPRVIASGVAPEKMAFGNDHTIWLEDGRLYGMGVNTTGALGAVERACEPTDLGFDNVTNFTAGHEFTCAVSDHHDLRCVGNGTAGVTTHRFDAAVEELYGNHFSACARLDNGRVECWGRATSGRFGVTDYVNDAVGPPVPIEVVGAFGASVVRIAAVPSACAILPERGVHCWGLDDSGLLGAPRPADDPPRRVAVGPFVDLFSGGHTTFGRLADGRLMAWGRNEHGQLGLGWPSLSERPTLVPGLTAVEVAASSWGVCARREDGTLWCWGDPAGIYRLTPLRKAGLVDVVQVEAGQVAICALNSSGVVTCFGGNHAGIVEPISPEIAWLTPRVIGLPLVPERISVGYDSACALSESDDIYCWGASAKSRLPLDLRTAPVNVQGAANLHHAVGNLMVRHDDGTVTGVGDNDGRLGTGDLRRREAFSAAVGLEDVVEVSAHAWHGCARTADGAVYCWGQFVTPTTRPGRMDLPPVKRLSSGVNFGCALDLEGAAWCWGLASTLAIDGTFFGSLDPVQVPGLVGRGPVN